jgi:beta-glucosidase
MTARGRFRFPDGFHWGAATSAQQIEGAVREDGRGESVWDHFALVPGNIADRSDPSIACDHFHRWRDDLAVMAEIGLTAYRFSIAWPRVMPHGFGDANPRGLEFYDRLVDGLLAAGITPFVTLNHWDTPQTLQERGGWVSRDTAHAFDEYAVAVVERLGDRVRHWITHNEPWCQSTLGYEQGRHAPGHRNPGEALAVAHHLLLSHGWAASSIRRRSPAAQVGISHILVDVHPASGSDADRDAARALDGTFNRWYLDPIFRGSYPQDVIADRVRDRHLATAELPFLQAGDMAAIATPIDFLGVNYYSRSVVRAGDDGRPVGVPMASPEQRTATGWEVWPQGLHDVLTRVAREYAPTALYVTENGAAFEDRVEPSGRVVDERRIEFLRGHLDAAARAIAAGVPLAGYFVWSLLDNWEWADGYEKRFGIVRVDYPTQRRTLKDSAHWYRSAIAARGLPDDAGAPSRAGHE